MSDQYDPQLTEEEGNPTPPDYSSTSLLAEDDIEVQSVGETKEPVAPAEVDLLKQQLVKQQELITKLEAKQNIGAAVSESLAPVLERIGQPAQPVIMPQQQGETEEEFEKRLDENAFEMGVSKAMKQFFNRNLAPEVRRLMVNNVHLSKKFVQLDPNKSKLYAKYGKEIDAYVAAQPPNVQLSNPDIYDDAVNAVASRHSEELLNEQLETRLASEREKIKAEILKEVGAGKPAGSKPVFNATNPNQPTPTKKSNTLTVKQLVDKYPDKAKEAFVKGIPVHIYFKHLAEKGLLK